MSWITESNQGVIIRIRLSPRASNDAVVEIMGNELKIRVNAPPVDGRANKALRKFIAGILGIAAGKIEIISGAGSRSKRILVRGVGAEKVKELLLS